MLITNVISANAGENVLSGIEVSNGNNSYNIELTTNEPVKINKTIISTNRIILNLDNIKTINDITPKYGANTILDNVIIDTIGKNKVSIMLQGDNIVYSDIKFKSPSSVKQIENSVIDSVTNVGSSLVSYSNNRTMPFVFLILLGGILLSEIKFIKNKYKELDKEKSIIEKDIERTSEFKEFLNGYGNQGIKKPYSTPIYTNPKDTSLIRANYLKRLHTLQTPETVTLNSLLNSNNQETKIINKIINNQPIFGSLSNIVIERKNTETNTTTNPLSKATINSKVQHLETLSKLYKDSLENNDTLETRLNQLY
jgi:hypothetical protein